MDDPNHLDGRGLAARVAALPLAVQLCLFGVGGLVAGALLGLGPGLVGEPTVADPGGRRLVGFAGLWATAGCASLCGGLTLTVVHVGVAVGLLGSARSEG
jgi:hypothetical protein